MHCPTQKKNCPILSKPNLPIHTPIPRSIFSLQKEVQSHACKPVLGFSLPKMGYDPFCKGLRCSFLFTKSLFQIGWLQNKTIFLQRLFPKDLFAKSTVFKMKIAFCKVFFVAAYPFCKGMFVADHPFCKGIRGLQETSQWLLAR